MVDTDDDTESIVTRMRGSQRALIVMAAMVILVGAAGIAVAQTGTIIEDFEDGNSGIFSTGSVISNNSIEGKYSYQWNVNEEFANADSFPTVDGSISFYYRQDSQPGDYVDVRLIDSRGGTLDDAYELVFSDNGVAYDNEDSDSEYAVELFDYNIGTAYYFDYNLTSNTLTVYNSSDWNVVYNGPTTEAADSAGGVSSIIIQDYGGSTHTVDYFRGGNVPLPGGPTISGTVTDGNNQPIENATVTAELQGSGDYNISAETDMNGNYGITVTNGTYNVTASKDGYFPEEATVNVSGDDVTQDFQIRNHSAALSIDTRSFLKHGLSAPYSVTYEGVPSGRLVRDDVTDNATVTSGDTSVVTVDQGEEEIVATSDTSVNNRTYIEAEYSTGGEDYTARQNVTVANETVDNLDILPPVNRFTSSLQGGTDANPNDKTIMLLIIGAAAGAAASLIATSFAGVGAFCMVLLLGWIMGMTSDGMAIVTVFISLFIGLNVAGNVDYTVRR